MSPDPRRPALPLPADWTFTATAFNLTAQVVQAQHPAPDLAISLVERGIVTAIELEPGQLWRGFPDPSPSALETFRTRMARAGGSVSIVGASIDEWASTTRRRGEDERASFLEPQLRAAAALGAIGVRLPIGQAGPALLRRMLPLLDELDLILFEEAQGDQSPQHPAYAKAYDLIAELDSPRIRLLLDISMLMPALPTSFLERLAFGGLAPSLVERLRDEWAGESTHSAVVDALRAGLVPPALHTLYMNMLVRFGRSHVADVESVLPLVSGVHLKFWDLDDADGRVSAPIRDLGAALRRSGYRGTLCSEWGGLEWLDDDPWEMTAAHLQLASKALSAH